MKYQIALLVTLYTPAITAGSCMSRPMPHDIEIKAVLCAKNDTQKPLSHAETLYHYESSSQSYEPIYREPGNHLVRAPHRVTIETAHIDPNAKNTAEVNLCVRSNGVVQTLTTNVVLKSTLPVEVEINKTLFVVLVSMIKAKAGRSNNYEQLH